VLHARGSRGDQKEYLDNVALIALWGNIESENQLIRLGQEKLIWSFGETSDGYRFTRTPFGNDGSHSWKGHETGADRSQHHPRMT
jgi:hypothetical protein